MFNFKMFDILAWGAFQASLSFSLNDQFRNTVISHMIFFLTEGLLQLYYFSI